MLAFAIMLAHLVSSPGSALECRVLVVAKRAGEPIYAADLALAACPSHQPRALLRYDARRHLVLARTDLTAGTELGHAFAPQRPTVVTGDRIRITVGIGHVTISRGARALQSAGVGQRFFARTDDGTVIVAPSIGAGSGLAKRDENER